MLTFMFAGQGGSQIYSQTLAYTWGQARGTAMPRARMRPRCGPPKMKRTSRISAIRHFGLRTAAGSSIAQIIKLKNLSLSYNVPQNVLAGLACAA